MTPEQLKILETTILLLDKGDMEILLSGLMPYKKKAEKIVEIINN